MPEPRMRVNKSRPYLYIPHSTLSLTRERGFYDTLLKERDAVCGLIHSDLPQFKKEH